MGREVTLEVKTTDRYGSGRWRGPSTPGGRRYLRREIGSFACAQELLRQGHIDLDSNGTGDACEFLR